MTTPPTVIFNVEPTSSQTNQALHLRAQHPDGCKLEMRIPAPDGPIHCWAWTRGGERLGDQLDVAASYYGATLADLAVLADRHTTVSYAADIRIAEIRLAPVLADLRAGERADEGTQRAAERAVTAWRSSGGGPHVSFGPEMIQATNRPAGRGR